MERWSQCTYRCVVLPDDNDAWTRLENNESQCTYRCVVLPDQGLQGPWAVANGLNAPTGAWCSLTGVKEILGAFRTVSMHLQVRGAP